MPYTSADWVEAAAPQMGGCPLVTMQQEWLGASKEFFTRSTAWRQELAPISIVAATDSYTLVSPVTDSEIAWVHQVSIPDRYLSPSAHHPVVLSTQTSNTPTQFSNPEPGVIRLWPMPSENLDSMIVIASLYPTALTTSLPDYLGAQHFDVLLSGMLGRLMNYKNKPFSNPEGSAYHLSRFRSGMARVRADAIHGLNESENYWAFPKGFARGRGYL